MRFVLMIWLIGTGNAVIQKAYASPSEANEPAISQIIITQYIRNRVTSPNGDNVSRIVLRRDGSAIFVGSTAYMKRNGRYHGIVEQRDFLHLANLFQQNNFQNWSNSYNESNAAKYRYHQISIVKYEIISGNLRKTVVVYGDSGPKAIRGADCIYCELMESIRWQKVSASDAIED